MSARNRKLVVLFFSGLIMFSLILSACTPASTEEAAAEAEEEVEDEGQDQASEPTEAAPDGDPLPGGTLVIGLLNEPDTLDPHMTTMGYILDYIGIALIDRDKDNIYVPWAAESWDISADGLSYTFNLRQDIKFQDGTPLTAKDFVYTYKRALDPSSTGAASQMLAGVTEISALDDFTLLLTLSTPNYYLLDNLTITEYLQPVSEAWVNSQGEALGHNPLSAGPYKLKEYVTGDHVTLERNPDYTWAPAFAHQGPAYFQEIIFRFIPEVSTLLAGLEAEEIDFAQNGIDVQYVDRIEAMDSFSVLKAANQGCEPYVVINTARAPFTDLKVRQALGYAIDKQAMIDVVLHGNGTIQAGPLSISMIGYWPGIEEIGYTYDVEKAKTLLTEAGYIIGEDGIMTNGEQVLKLDLLTSSDFINTAQMLKEQYKLIGVEINIVQQEFALLINSVVSGEFDLALFTYGYSNGGILPMIFHSRMEGMMNPSHVNDPELDVLLDRINSETDPVKQQEALDQAQKIIIEKAYMLPLYNTTKNFPLSNKVRNYIFSENNNTLYLQDAYLNP